MPYQTPSILLEQMWNNAFAWEKRTQMWGKTPSLYIPKVINGIIDDVKIWNEVVFEEVENDILRSCIGLENFVKISDKIVVFDNHNHALYFWMEAIRNGIIEKWFELIHIDEHSDLWDNTHHFDYEQSLKSPEYTWNFVNIFCNVGNYILPAIESGVIWNMIRIENEYQIDAFIDYKTESNSVLNLDLDIFAPELDHIPENKKIQIIKNLLRQVKYVTIATSPFFIDQWKAIEMLNKILKNDE